MNQQRVAGRTDLKRISLMILGGVIFAVSIWPGSIWPGFSRSTGLLAQQSPLGTGTPTLTPTITTTPAPTPTKVKRVVNEIVAPTESDAISGDTAIIGTPLIDTYHRHDIHISPAGMEDWQWLTTSYEVIHDDVLYVLDTTAFVDGFYDLRLRAIRDDGNYGEFFVRGVEIRNENPPTRTPIPNATPTPFSPLPTPTPTVDISSRIPGGPGFYAPDNGSVLRGIVDIVATINGTPQNPFARYELSISPAAFESWTWIAGGSTQFWQDVIYGLDTTELSDGLYDLRLRIVHQDSNYSEYYLRNLSVANRGEPRLAFAPPAGIISPRSGSRISGVVDFIGTVPPDDLLRWELSWSPGEREEWTFLVSSDRVVTEGVLARLDLSQLPSGLYDFRLRAIRSDNNYSEYVVRNLRLVQPD